jgi:hypothetical protein
LGLVDELGNMEHALNQAGKLAGIKGKPEAIYATKKRTTFWELILQNAVSSFIAEWKGQESRHSGLYFVCEPAANLK